MTSPQYFVLDCILAMCCGTVAVVPNMSPSANDMIAVLGAMLATVIAVLEARKKDRTLGNIISIVVGSSFVGSIAPGALFFNFWPNAAAGFTWHMWAALGFLCGLLGWTVVHVVFAIIRIVKRRQDGLIDGFVNRFDPAPPRRGEPPDDPPCAQ